MWGKLLGKVFRALEDFIRWFYRGLQGEGFGVARRGFGSKMQLGGSSFCWEFCRDRVNVCSSSLIPSWGQLKPPDVSPLMEKKWDKGKEPLPQKPDPTGWENSAPSEN